MREALRKEFYIINLQTYRSLLFHFFLLSHVRFLGQWLLYYHFTFYNQPQPLQHSINWRIQIRALCQSLEADTALRSPSEPQWRSHTPTTIKYDLKTAFFFFFDFTEREIEAWRLLKFLGWKDLRNCYSIPVETWRLLLHVTSIVLHSTWKIPIVRKQKIALTQQYSRSAKLVSHHRTDFSTITSVDVIG